MQTKASTLHPGQLAVQLPVRTALHPAPKAASAVSHLPTAQPVCEHSNQLVPVPWSGSMAITGNTKTTASAEVVREQHKQRVRQQKSFGSESARMLTRQIAAAADVTQLLQSLWAWQQQQQLDCIHVSAAVKHACRSLGLVLQLPQQQQEQSLQLQQAVAGWEWLVWVQDLDMVAVQQRLQQLQQQKEQHTQQANCSQQTSIQWMVDQQIGPKQILEQQLALHVQRQQPSQHLTAAEQLGEQQLQRSPQQLSDSWLLLVLLSELVCQHAGAMAPQQLCTCLNGFTYLLQQHPDLPLLTIPAHKAAIQELLTSVDQQLHTFQPQGLSLLLQSAACLARSPGGLVPNQRFMKRWYRCSQAQMAAFSPLDLSMSAWALGRLRLYPPSQWSMYFWGYSQAALPSMQPQELVQLLFGVAYTNRRPTLGWAAAVADHLQPQLQVLTPKQLSTTLLAFAKLQHLPDQAWMAAFITAWEVQELQFSAKGHAVVLWGVGTLAGSGRQATIEWVRRLQRSLQLAVTRAATAVATVALQKLRQAGQLQQQQQLAQQQQPQQLEQQESDDLQQLQVHLPPLEQQGAVYLQQQRTSLQQPHGEVLQAYATALQPELSQQQEEQPQLLSSASLLHPTDCAMVMYALARLGPSSVDQDFTAFWLKQSRSQMVNMNSQELASCLWALGRLRLRPPAVWLEQHLAATGRLASCLSHQQLAMVLWGCARLRYMPNVLVTAELLMSAAEQLHNFSTGSLALMMWSLGGLRLKPNKEWMQLVLKQAQYKLPRFREEDFFGLLLGLHNMHYDPGQQWMDKFVAALATNIHMVSAQKHKVVVTIVRAMGYTCEGRPFAWVMNEAAVAAMCNQRHRPQAGAVHVVSNQPVAQ